MKISALPKSLTIPVPVVANGSIAKI